MSKSSTADDVLVQLAARIPRRIARDVKTYCVRNDVRLQTFVRAALTERLTTLRPRRSA